MLFTYEKPHLGKVLRHVQRDDSGALTSSSVYEVVH